MAKDLVLVSPFNPDAGFDVGNAMARNKYIYCLADAAIVIAASKERGGTWNGAVENLKKGWVPLWVKPHQDPASGNAELVKRGAQWLPDGEPSALSVRDLMEPVDQPDSGLPYVLALESSVSDGSAEYRPESGSACLRAASHRQADRPAADKEVQESQRGYDLFLHRLKQLTAEAPATPEQLKSSDVSSAQLRDWLKRAVSEGHVRKLNKPVRYQREPQRDLFDDTDSVRAGNGVAKP
jgi:predicted Rossmann fold nucleotide-binding protein DprA/Smf involved in DNA uptake